MCAANQDRHADTLSDIESLCESPQDFPAKWATMIYGYFDESVEDGDGYYVVAGFVGRKRDWKKFAVLWPEALGDHGPLHIKELRLGSSKAPKRYGELLERLARVPPACNLRPFVGSVRTGDYRDRIKGTVADLVLSGYTTALTAMVGGILESDLPKRDRIEFIFEQQVEYAVSREMAFKNWRESAHYKTHHGNSRIGKNASMEKGTLLEASDYLAYAILQQLIDHESQKASLTVPIIRQYPKMDHRKLDRASANHLIDLASDQAGGLPAMDRNMKAELKRIMKEES
jgi:hypothetical protein